MTKMNNILQPTMERWKRPWRALAHWAITPCQRIVPLTWSISLRFLPACTKTLKQVVFVVVVVVVVVVVIAVGVNEPYSLFDFEKTETRWWLRGVDCREETLAQPQSNCYKRSRQLFPAGRLLLYSVLLSESVLIPLLLYYFPMMMMMDFKICDENSLRALIHQTSKFKA